MFSTFFGFELTYWLRRMMLYIFLFIITALILAAMSSDTVRVGASVGNTIRNAPFAIQNFYSGMGILCCLMTTAFVNDAASRDFACNSHQLMFSKPMSKWSFLMGRYWGALVISLIPLLGVSIGAILAPNMPWNDDPEQFGSIHWGAHFWGFVLFALPNTIVTGAAIFAIAIWLRSTFASFIGIILILMFSSMTQSLLGNLDNETLSQLADPFGIVAFSTQTKYWTNADKETMAITLGNTMMLYNRLIWLAVGATLLLIACSRFSFSERNRRFRKRVEEKTTSTLVAIPQVQLSDSRFTSLQQFFSQFKIDFLSTVKSPVFLVIVFASMIDTFFSLRMVANEGFGLRALPVTYQMINIIRGGMYVYLLAVIIFYSGVLVWKERESRLDEVMDAMPHSTAIAFLAKLLTLVAVVAMVLCAYVLMAVVNQAMAGYTRFQLGLYFKELFLISFVWIFGFMVLSLLLHAISPNKYVGYFAIVIAAIANVFLWPWLEVQSNLIQFASLPTYIYSDMFQFKPYVSGLFWFGAYWILFSILLGCVAILFWQRGRDQGPGLRIPLAFQRAKSSLGTTTAGLILVWAAIGGWIYFNTEVVNEYDSIDHAETKQVSYEEEFKKYQNLPQPRVISVKHEIDLFPHQRKLVFNGDQVIENQSDDSITRLLLNINDDFENTIEVENATLVDDHTENGLWIYEFNPALEPGQRARMTYSVSYAAKGFENSVSQLQIVQNGSFFNNQIAPQIGYQPARELSDKDDRKKRGLDERKDMPELQPENEDARRNTYLSNSSDWLEIETIFSTSADQVAIAPGSLIRKWQKDGRRYFHYKLDHPSLNFYSFISADYQVALREWQGVDIEVYYQEEHQWNVDKMLRSIRKSLEYYSEHFGPYKHKQARIIEFPRTATFAQAFPGTMPYSEGIGFIADIKDESDIDMVYYVVAHEMAHQWWAHQVIGANMSGATLLSETLAQYSALMVMEKEYGRDIMRKFMKHEMNSYLSARGSQTRKERALREVSASQGYVHYNKGSVVMYHLKEMIGEDKINQALRSLVDRFAYKSHPYPTSQDLINALKESTPVDQRYLIDDLFYKIVLFENRTLNTTYKPVDDGRYEVTIDVECRKFEADDDGKQSEVAINDWIEIGAFAEPDGDNEYGETLYRKRVKIRDNQGQYTFIVDQVPALAGVDPFLLLIDRLPEDNLKRPVRIETARPQN